MQQQPPFPTTIFDIHEILQDIFLKAFNLNVDLPPQKGWRWQINKNDRREKDLGKEISLFFLLQENSTITLGWLCF